MAISDETMATISPGGVGTVGTTLAQDQEKAANQGKPGYDVLGNPIAQPSSTTSITPTTISGDKTQQISSDTTKLTNAVQSNPTMNGAAPGVSTAREQNGTYTGIDGNLYYNWDNTPVTGQGSMIPGTTLQSTGDTGTDSILKQMNDMKTSMDASSATLMANIQTQYGNLIAKQQDTNARGEASINQTLLLGGSSRYAGVSAQGISTAVVSAGLDKISALQTQENDALVKAQQAQQSGDMEILNKQMAIYEKIREEKSAEQTKLNQQLVEQNQQATKDKAIASVLSSGITDPSAIVSKLSELGYTNISAKDVSDTLANLQPDAKMLTDLMKTASSNGAPADVLKSIGSAKTLSEGFVAAGKYAAGGTGDIARYNQYVASLPAGTTPLDPISWLQAINKAKAVGTASGKVTGTTGGVGSNIVTIPQNIGTTTNQLAFRNNNPGNLRFIGQAGATQGEGGFAKFDTPQDGYNALVNDITSKVNSGLYSNLQDMMSKYAPASDNNDPVAYANFIAKNLGVSSTTPLSKLDPAQIAQQIAQYESGTKVVAVGRPDPSITDPNQEQTNLGGLSKNGLDVAANNYITSKTMPSLGLGANGNVQVARMAVINRAGELTKGNATAQQALYKALSSSQSSLTTKLTQTSAASKTALDNLDLALQQSPQVTRTDSAFINSMMQKYQSNFTEAKELTRFETYIYTAAREYAKVTSGGAGSTQGLTDTAAKEASKLLNASQTPGGLQAAIEAMKNDMSNVTSGMTSEQGAVQSQIQNLTSSNPDISVAHDDIQNQQKLDSYAVTPEKKKEVYDMLSQKHADGKPWNNEDVVQYLTAVGKIK